MDSIEAQSTEELLREIDYCSERLVREGTTGLVIGSMDVKALYTSLDQLAAAKDIKEEFIRSELEVTNVDYRAAAVYLASTCSEAELSKEGML